MANNNISGERRSHRRYSLTLQMEYRVLNGGIVIARGGGTTENLSSGGLFFHPDRDIETGRAVELSIRWPAMPEDLPFVELCVYGHTLRADSSGVAVRVARYHFEHPSELDRVPDDAMVQ